MYWILALEKTKLWEAAIRQSCWKLQTVSRSVLLDSGSENGKPKIYRVYFRSRRLCQNSRLDTINSLPPNLIYKSATETAKELVPQLRAQGAQIIIALTHAREPSDVKLAEKTPPGLIDLILGGHDHFYAHQIINKTHVLRSGTDFKQLSYIEARRKANDQLGWDFDITRRDITRALPEDRT